MAVSLTKGSKINLSKTAESQGAGLAKIAVGLGWDVRQCIGASFDLDAWALFVEDNQLNKKNLVYFGNKLDRSGSIHHMGDNLTGAGDGDDETIEMNLSNLPMSVTNILVGVTIYRGGQKNQSFKDIDNTFIRIYDKVTGIEICRYDDQFKTTFGNSQTLLFAILSRNGAFWDFNAIGEGSKMTRIPDAMNTFADWEYLLQNANGNITNNTNGGKKKMAVSLSKGGKVSLAKVASDAGVGSLDKITVGLGWDTNRYDGGADFDLDAAAFMLKGDGKVRQDTDFIFYNNKKGPGVEHTGDNRTGEGEGDDEQIKIILSQIPADVEKIDFTVTIDQADTRNQNFGMVENSFIRIVDDATGTELIRYDLGEDFSVETAIVVAELYRNNGEWKFNAIGSGFAGGLAALCRNFGVDV